MPIAVRGLSGIKRSINNLFIRPVSQSPFKRISIYSQNMGQFREQKKLSIVWIALKFRMFIDWFCQCTLKRPTPMNSIRKRRPGNSEFNSPIFQTTCFSTESNHMSTSPVSHLFSARGNPSDIARFISPRIINAVNCMFRGGRIPQFSKESQKRSSPFLTNLNSPTPIIFV